MANYTNYLLFNNEFIKKLAPSAEEESTAWSFIRSTAREYYRQADFSSPARMAQTFIRPLLQIQALDMSPAGLVNEGEFLLAAPWDLDHPLGVIWVAPHGVNLDGYDEHQRIIKGQHWMQKTIESARRANLRWAVLTNGDCWRLLDAQHLRCYEAYLEINLQVLIKAHEPSADLYLAAHLFFTIFQLNNSFDEGGSGLVDLLEHSQHATEKTERYLKQAVCDSLDTPGGEDGIMAYLCLGLVRAVDPTGDHIFTEEERSQIYQDATYLLYRLLFILYAEARGLLPAGQTEYQTVSLETLVNEAIQMVVNPQPTSIRPTSLWDGLTALFNFIDIGDPPLSIPPFDGGLFDDSDRPYLSHFKLDNSFVAPALYHLAYELDAQNITQPNRIDYRDLSVRHLGSLYEGMIEYRLYIAEGDLLARREKDGRVRFVRQSEVGADFAGEKISAGQVYFAQSPHERKSTGTHYTAEEFVEKLVRQTVLRLLEERWAAFEPQLAGWLAELPTLPTAEKHSAMRHYIDERLEEFIDQQVLSLRVCDPAMGSGHFLVHTAHQITRFILHTLGQTIWDNPNMDLSPERWRRQVVEHCLYGVDINPMAVELAKLSLWLATMQSDRPLSFLDHHLKCGNSLLGVRFDEIQMALRGDGLSQVTRKSALAEARGQYSLSIDSRAEQAVEDAVRYLDRLAQRDASQIDGVAAQKTDYCTARQRLDAYRAVGDFLTALKMGLKASPANVQAIALALEHGELPKTKEQILILDKATNLLADKQTFHWEIEYPEIFLPIDSPGFDIVLGNPPFMGGSLISSQAGNEFLVYLKKSYLDSESQTDLCAYFFRLGFTLLRKYCYLGMVSTNTISQGDTRKTGLAYILKNDGLIVYADRFIKWPGDATVEVNLICIKKYHLANSPSTQCILDGIEVPFISSRLDDTIEIEPHHLHQNVKQAFLGDSLKGIGFVITQDEANYLIQKNAMNRDCILPFPNGIDINNDPLSRPSRYVICFYDWDLSKAKRYPDLLKIVEDRVKPQRERTRSDVPVQVRRKELWWLFGSPSTELYKHISGLSFVLARSRVSEYNIIVKIPTDMRFGDSLVVFAYDDYYHFALLQSWIHEVWLRRQASTLESRNRYTPTDCFQTFPFPQAPASRQTAAALAAGQAFYEYRQQILLARQLGLTKLYNLINDPACLDEDIQQMRKLQIEMDGSILARYSWEDIELRHDFYPNDRQKVRYMPNAAAQREVFTRLMVLNQQIAAIEAAQGLQPGPADESEDEEEE